MKTVYIARSEVLVMIEQQILAEEDYKGANMHGRAYPRMLASGDLDYSDHYKIFLELQPEVFRENNFIKHYLREEQRWKGTVNIF